MEIFDIMAKIVRLLLDRKFVADRAMAVSKESIEQIRQKMNHFLNLNELLELQIQNVENMQLVVLLQQLDEKSVDELGSYLWSSINYDNIRTIYNGLNSIQSIKETNIIVLPRYECIWDGKSRDQHHIININTLVKNSFFVEVENGKVEGKYTIINHFLNPKYFGIYCDNSKRSELYLDLAISPLTKNIQLNLEKYTDELDGAPVHFFMVDEMNIKEQDELVSLIEIAIRQADEAGNKILVFPEMLGTHRMKEIIKDRLNDENLRNLHFIVFPGIWDKKGKHKNTNVSYVIDFEGNEWFGQHKLREFPLENEEGTFLEDIIEGKQIHLIHYKEYGSIAIAVCRSELDSDIKDLLMNKLNVKLILCPSWSTGSHEFSRSILTGVEKNCNAVWCNTCSALSNKKVNKENVGIITSFGKNRNYSRIDLNECKFPKDNCRMDCENGCLFSKKIFGTDYCESQVENDD